MLYISKMLSAKDKNIKSQFFANYFFLSKSAKYDTGRTKSFDYVPLHCALYLPKYV